MATKRDIENRMHIFNALQSIGFTYQEADALRLISVRLRSWFERECGTDNGCIERDETTNKTYWLNSSTMRRYPIRDMETGARKRLGAIVQERNRREGHNHPAGDTWAEWAVSEYVQTDPRGAAVYILRPKDIPQGQSVGSSYSNGICVY